MRDQRTVEDPLVTRGRLSSVLSSAGGCAVRRLRQAFAADQPAAPAALAGHGPSAGDAVDVRTTTPADHPDGAAHSPTDPSTTTTTGAQR